jgi:hypothetical protein
MLAAYNFLMKTSYHCAQCDKEFLDIDLAAEHKKATGHAIVERVLET